MERNELEALIHEAFAGVRLGNGVSLRQAEAIDTYLDGVDPVDFRRLPLFEVTDDWTEIPEDELETAEVAHLDAEGLRYYLPALLLWLLNTYGRDLLTWTGDDARIGTLMALRPDRYRRQMYEAFTPEQRAAVARYVEALPRLVALRPGDAMELERAFEDYWRDQLLPRP